MLVRALTADSVDVLVIMTGEILRAPVLEAPRLGVINKHAALLPAHRGLLPFIHARIAGHPQGVSFHRVTPEVDEGPLLIQERIPETHCASLVSFHEEITRRYPAYLVRAVEALVGHRTITPDHGLPPSRTGLPTRADLRAFRAAGGRILNLTEAMNAQRHIVGFPSAAPDPRPKRPLAARRTP